MPAAPRHAIITGASRGLGEATAHALARQAETASLTLLARDGEALSRVADDIRRKGFQGVLASVTADLSDGTGISACLGELAGLKLPFNVLVNNAGTGYPAALEATPPEQIERILSVNLAAPLRLAGFVVPMARRQGFGRVVSISSISALRPSPDGIPYATAKAGLMALTEGLCGAEAAAGITANTICPGLLLTDMGRDAIRRAVPEYNEFNAERIEAAIARQLPAGRLTSMDEITAVVAFLISDAGAGINGEFLRIAAGLL